MDNLIEDLKKDLKAFKIIDKIWDIFKEEKADEEMIENILESMIIENIHIKMLKNKK